MSSVPHRVPGEALPVAGESGRTMRKTAGKELEEAIYEKQVQICKAFANATRLRILDLVAKKTMTASELQSELGISKANLSQHLTILRSAGVIETHRNGKSVLCALAIPEVKQACSLIREVLRAQLRAGRRMVV
jgi:DNA-binding transcriptional ArsR family regulator